MLQEFGVLVRLLVRVVYADIGNLEERRCDIWYSSGHVEDQVRWWGVVDGVTVSNHLVTDAKP